MQGNKINIVFGTTASGKTELAVKLAHRLKENSGQNSAIINADSMQIYREIPIVTNQPTDEEKQGFEHFMLGNKSILEHSDLNLWLQNASSLVNELREQNRPIILVGGTGMYLRAIIEGVVQIPDIPRSVRGNIIEQIEKAGIEEVHEQLITRDEKAKILKPKDTQRVIRALEVIEFTGKSIFDWQQEPPKHYFGNSEFTIHFIEIDREKTYEKINSRFKNMVELGAVAEAITANKIFEQALEKGTNINNLPAHKAHGLRELIAYSKGEMSLEAAIEKGAQVTRNYAKRQLTWWRGWQENLSDTVKVEIY